MVLLKDLIAMGFAITNLLIIPTIVTTIASPMHVARECGIVEPVLFLETIVRHACTSTSIYYTGRYRIRINTVCIHVYDYRPPPATRGPIVGDLSIYI